MLYSTLGIERAHVIMRQFSNRIISIDVFSIVAQASFFRSPLSVVPLVVWRIVHDTIFHLSTTIADIHTHTHTNDTEKCIIIASQIVSNKSKRNINILHIHTMHTYSLQRCHFRCIPFLRPDTPWPSYCFIGTGVVACWC